MRLWIVLLIFMLMSYQRFAKTPVAKIILLKGQVSAYLSEEEKTYELTKSSLLFEGTTVLTEKSSLIKLKFIDGSRLVLGPSGKLLITKFNKKKAGVISLMRGQLRSIVTKDYMKFKDKNRSKLYITTKTSAMGVRGTDFQVSFDPDKDKTELFVKKGKVAMAQVDTEDMEFDDQMLEDYLNDPESVMVTKGQYSFIEGSEGPLVPRNIDKVKVKLVKVKKKQKRRVDDFEWEDPAMRAAMAAMKKGEDDVDKHLRRIKNFRRYFNQRK